MAELADTSWVESLYSKVSVHIDRARQSVQRSIDTEMIRAYWQIGREIVEEEQHDQERAGYGQMLLKTLSIKLEQKYIRGFGVDTLENIRNFYLIYQSVVLESKSESLLRKSNEDTLGSNSATMLRNLGSPNFHHNLSWTHYILLI